jgi:hypothetical protein
MAALAEQCKLSALTPARPQYNSHSAKHQFHVFEFPNFLQLPLADLAIPIEPLFCHVVESVCFTLFPKLPHALSYIEGMSVLNSELGKTGDLHVVCARLSVPSTCQFGRPVKADRHLFFNTLFQKLLSRHNNRSSFSQKSCCVMSEFRFKAVMRAGCRY